MRASIESEVETHTYWVIVTDLDGGPAGPYELKAEDLEIETVQEE